MLSELSDKLQIRKNQWASEIIVGKLWLGNGSQASDLDELRKRGITHILNVTDDVPNYHDEPPFVYLKLEIQDFGQDKGITRAFDAAFAFLYKAEADNEPVLIHCAGGANRSATMTIAWLMHSQHLTLAEAYRRVKAIRRGISPLRDNRLQLLQFELSLYGTNSFASDEFFC